MSADPSHAPRPKIFAGTQIGRFTVRRMLGRGSAATVVQVDVDNEGTNLPAVATLKVYDGRERAGSRGAPKREARYLKLLEGLRVPKVLARGSSRYGRWVLMDHIQGVSLSQLINTHGAFSLREGTQVVAELAKTVVGAHERDVVHADVQPKNSILTPTGDVYLCDLETAGKAGKARRIAPSGHVVGTIGYVSPRMLKGERVLNPQDDVFALAGTLCRTVTGRTAHELAGLGQADLRTQGQWYLDGGFHNDPAALKALEFLVQDDRLVSIIMGAMHPDETKRTAGFEFIEQLTQYEKLLNAEQMQSEPTHYRGRHAADPASHRGRESAVLEPVGRGGRHAVGADTAVLPILDL